MPTERDDQIGRPQHRQGHRQERQRGVAHQASGLTQIEPRRQYRHQSDRDEETNARAQNFDDAPTRLRPRAHYPVSAGVVKSLSRYGLLV